MRAPTAASFSPARGRPSCRSATSSLVRAISVTTCRVRRTRMSASSWLPCSLASRRSSAAGRSCADRSASSSIPRMRAERSQAARRAPYWPSTRECLALVSMTSRASPSAARSKGTWVTEPSLQSSSRAWPSRQRSEADWSMPPVGAPAISFSVRTHTATSRARPASSGCSALPARPSPATSSMATAAEHSSAAEEDRPPPRGTQETRAASNPGRSETPSCSSAQATPAM
ncbi:hypothetical protein ACSL103130_11170 [Actinomyces slackii]